MPDEDLVAIRDAAERVIEALGPGPDGRDPAGLLDELEAHRDPGGVDLRSVRLRSLRRLLLRLVRPSTAMQTDFNTATVEILRRLVEAVEGLGRGATRLEAAVSASRATLADLEAVTERLSRELDAGDRELANRLEAVAAEFGERLGRVESAAAEQAPRLESLGEVPGRLEEQAAVLERLLSAHRVLQGSLDILIREFRTGTEADRVEAVEQADGRRFDEFYAAFEASLRGDRATIKDRQRPYLTFLEGSRGPVCDLGTGRAEWLELLGEHDVEAYGVDLNEVCVDEARQRGLDVRLADVFEHLASVPDGSLGAVTAFQLVEHLAFDRLDTLVTEAFRVLRPGGVLVLETPNPSNLRVGAMSFWNDPTHQRPLPPALLEFLVRWRGFVDARLVFPDPPVERSLDIDGAGPALADVNWALFGPEDYAVVARRP